MKHLRGKVAVVTGAASGIGRALALRLADKGCHLALSDLNEEALEETGRMARERGAVDMHLQRLDVADRKAFYAYAETVSQHFDAVHLVINNAGVAMGGTVKEMSIEDLEWLIGINFWGVVYGTKAFLPHLERAGEGHIVNISSVFGLIAAPSQSAYNAAKFAVRGFTEALRQELELEDSSVSCTCVHPGGINTNIARSARMVRDDVLGFDKESMASHFEKIARTSPDEAARQIIQAVVRNQRRLLIGADAHLIDATQRAFPTFYQRMLSVVTKFGRKS